MGVLTTVLLVLGILMLLEGSFSFFFPKIGLKFLKKFNKHIEKNIRSWAIGEVILAIILIIIGLAL